MSLARMVPVDRPLRVSAPRSLGGGGVAVAGVLVVCSGWRSSRRVRLGGGAAAAAMAVWLAGRALVLRPRRLPTPVLWVGAIVLAAVGCRRKWQLWRLLPVRPAVVGAMAGLRCLLLWRLGRPGLLRVTCRASGG